MPGAALNVDGLAVVFGAGSPGEEAAVDITRLAVEPGSLVAFTGPSGSGKTTLMHVLAGILRPTRGSVAWDGKEIAGLGEARRDAWRRKNVGLVFQDFHLIEQLSPTDNVLLPATFSHMIVPAALRRRAHDLLVSLGVPLERRAVADLSRGERQRVAIARALLFDPPILIADEPTASLDEAAAREVTGELLRSAAAGRTTVVVSHDRVVIDQADRVVRLERGRIAADGPRAELVA